MFHGILFFLQQPAAQPNAPFTLGDFLPLFFLWVFIIWLFAIRPQQKAGKKRLQKLNQLKKNDRVVTIGGIIGIIDHLTEREVVLKIDEKNNTKMHFVRSAIDRLFEEPKNEEKKDEKKDEKPTTNE